jgi:hypothetical protein
MHVPAIAGGSFGGLGTPWQYDVEIRPTWWPFVSAFVVRRPWAPPTLLTVAAETAILLENTNWRRGMALSWSGSAMSCPSHMSRSLTESLGLCIAIESASVYGWHPLAAILDADRLSLTSPLYVPTGSRPDFIVEGNLDSTRKPVERRPSPRLFDGCDTVSLHSSPTMETMT